MSFKWRRVSPAPQLRPPSHLPSGRAEICQSWIGGCTETAAGSQSSPDLLQATTTRSVSASASASQTRMLSFSMVTGSVICRTNKHAVLVLLIGFEAFLHQNLNTGFQLLVMPLLLTQRLLLLLQSLHAAPQCLTQLHLRDRKTNRLTEYEANVCAWLLFSINMVFFWFFTFLAVRSFSSSSRSVSLL